jgi:enoyl-[acyl-carrier protein] reductase III
MTENRSMLDLTGRVVLVTGSARGIGQACAVRLAQAGADVVINYLTSRTAADQTAQQIQALGRRVAVVKADVSEPDDVESMVDFVRDTFGRLDILVSNAATGGFRPVLAMTARQFEVAMNTNVRALILLLQACKSLLEKAPGRAKVIALSSHGSHLALPMYSLVGSTKAALESLVRHCALELGNSGINFNIVQAGLVDTDSTRQLPEPERIFEHARARSLVGGQLVRATDVAEAVLFLASAMSDTIQGHTLVVDGGTSIHA